MAPQDADPYLNREQSQIKHEILKKYLERFARIVGSRWNGIIYVDGFSGPWNTVSTDFRDSSFGIALTQLRAARETVKKTFNKDLKIECIFLEKDPGAFEQLNGFASKQDDIVVRPLNREFEESIPKLVELIRSKQPTFFPFILIDPKGWKGFAMEVIKPLIQMKPSELLVNFMTGHIHRFIEHKGAGIRNTFRELFGDRSYERRIEGLQGLDREDGIVQTYADRLSEVGNFPYVSTAFVLEPTRDRTYYNLVYATRNLKGIEVFKGAEKKALRLAEKSRADAKRRKRESLSRQPEFFSGSELPDTEYLAELQVRYEDRALRNLESLLKGKAEIAYDELYATALRFPTVQEAFLKEWLREQAEIIDTDGNKVTTPKILKKHRVRFLRRDR